MSMSKKNLSALKVLLTIIAGIIILLTGGAVSSLVNLLPVSELFLAILQCLIYIAWTLIMIRILIRQMGLSSDECRFGKFNIKLHWLLVGLLLPLLVIGSLLILPGKYIIQDITAGTAVIAVITSIFSVGLSAGITEELIFRGVIMRVLEKKWGRSVAILVPSIIFGLIHLIGSPFDLVDFILLLVAGTTVGIMFSLIALQSRSIWNSALVHGLWNTLVIGNILNIDLKIYEHVLINYQLSPTLSKILTGGEFGIESSLFAIIGYLLVCLYCLILMKKDRKRA